MWIKIEFVDVHFGTGPSDTNAIKQDPYLLEAYLDEISVCHKHSKSIFFMVRNIIFILLLLL